MLFNIWFPSMVSDAVFDLFFQTDLKRESRTIDKL